MENVPSFTLKWHRAFELYELIYQQSTEFVESEVTYSADLKLIAGEEWDILTWDDPGPHDPLLGVIIGEFIHDLRSALDHLIYDLIVTNNEDPGEHSQFPIYDSKVKWIEDIVDRDPARKPSPIRGVGAEQFAVIDQAQPYRVTHKQRLRHPLMQLLRMSNVDKHQTLHVVSVSSGAPKEIRYEPSGFVSIARGGRKIRKPGVLVKKGAEIGRLKRNIIRMPPPGTDVIVRIRGNAQFAFGEAGKPPIATLTDLSQMLKLGRSIILDLRPEADLSIDGLLPT